MDRIAEDYRNYLRIERGMSPNTVASYVRDVEGLLKAHEGCRPADIGTAELERYLGKRIAKGSPSAPRPGCSVPSVPFSTGAWRKAN